MQESRLERGERLQPLAAALAARYNFTLPSPRRDAVYSDAYYVSSFLVVRMRNDPDDFDDGHGCRQIGYAEWAENAQHAVAKVQGDLEWSGWRNIRVYDVERQEQCKFEFGIRMKYKAVTEVTVSVGTGCFDDAPMLSEKSK